MKGITCVFCARDRGLKNVEAIWFVWAQGWPIYTYLCDDCMVAAIRDGLPRTQLAVHPIPTERYPVTQAQRIQSVSDRALPDQVLRDRILKLEMAQAVLQREFDEFNQIVVIPGELPPFVDFSGLEHAIRLMLKE